MLTEEESEKSALELAVEDLYGLWEIVWRLNDLHKNMPLADLKEAAAGAVRRLISNGWVDLFRMSDPSRPRKPLDEKEVAELLSAPTVWDPPSSEGDEEYWIGATAAGKAQHYGRDRVAT